MGLYHTVFIQQGDSNTLQVANKELYNVVEEVWERSRLLRSDILSSHVIESEAVSAAQQSRYYRKPVDISDEVDDPEESDDDGDR